MFSARRNIWINESDATVGCFIGANIAEGSCRKGDCEFARFLQIAMGSASELEYHLLLARDLELLPAIDYQRLSEGAIEVKRMLASFLHKLRADN